LHFCRYLPELRDRVARLYLVLDGFYKGLAPLLSSLLGADAIVTDRKNGPPIHAFCPLLSLAHFAGASPERPGDVPYLSPPSERVRDWRIRLGERRNLRVGLVWAGNPRTTPQGAAIDARRSIDPALLGPFFEVPNIEWHSLQLGEGLAQWNRVPRAATVIDHREDLINFAETTALMANLDLIITVDTSVAHAAGAIGAPVFLLSRFDSCWRWGPRGRRTPWYPTMQIFRQHAFGDWGRAIADAAMSMRLFHASNNGGNSK
jgi:hypothetical protein